MSTMLDDPTRTVSDVNLIAQGQPNGPRGKSRKENGNLSLKIPEVHGGIRNLKSPDFKFETSKLILDDRWSG
jgi:hypothetical protein